MQLPFLYYTNITEKRGWQYMESFKTTSTSVTVPLWAKRSLMSAAVRDQDKLTTYSFFTLSVGCVSSGVSSVAATSCKVEHNWKQSLPVLKEDLEEKKREVEAWSLMEIGAFAENRWGAKRVRADSKVAIRNLVPQTVDKEIKGQRYRYFVLFLFYAALCLGTNYISCSKESPCDSVN